MTQESEQQQKERWLTAKEATALLNKNSGRENINEGYIRVLARSGKVAVKNLDKRTRLYRRSDLVNMVVQKHGKGDTVAARKAGSRRKSAKANREAEEAIA